MKVILSVVLFLQCLFLTCQAVNLNCTCPTNSSSSPSCISGLSSCQSAIKAYEWASDVTFALCQVYPSDLDNAEPPSCTSLCNQLHEVRVPDLYDNLLIFPEDLGSWANFNLQGGIGNAPFRGFSIGEGAFTINKIMRDWQALLPLLKNGTISNDDWFNIWLARWNARGDSIVQNANTYLQWGDSKSARDGYFRASIYYYTAQWPAMSTNQSIAVLQKSNASMAMGLSLWEGISTIFLEIPYITDDDQNILLPGYFLTNNPTTALPTIIFNTGADVPSVATILRYAEEFLSRGYACLFFDGPGQGNVIRYPPHTTYTPKWNRVIESVLDFIETDLSSMVNTKNIALHGISFGGWLGGQACSQVSDRLRACILNPPVQNFFDTFGYQFSTFLSQPYRDVPDSAIPSGYVPFIRNTTYLLETLFSCSEGIEWFQENVLNILSLPYDPDDLIAAYKFGINGSTPNYYKITNNVTALYQFTSLGIRNTQRFVMSDANIANISCPVLVTVGTEDTVENLSLSKKWFDKLNPNTRKSSVFHVFTAETGAGLHCQEGTLEEYLPVVFHFLNPIMMMSDSNTRMTNEKIPIHLVDTLN